MSLSSRGAWQVPSTGGSQARAAGLLPHQSPEMAFSISSDFLISRFGCFESLFDLSAIVVSLNIFLSFV